MASIVPAVSESIEMIQDEKVLLRYTFSEEEISELGKQMAGLNRQLHRLKEELAAIKKEYAADIKRTEAEIDLSSEHITNGFKMEMILCQCGIDHDAKEKRYWTMHQDPEKDEPVKVVPLGGGHQYTANFAD